MSEQTMPYTTPGRTVIPGCCWIRKPGTELRCTERPHATGDHYHAYSRQTWPHRGPEPQ
jgi:hypothetical protein